MTVIVGTLVVTYYVHKKVLAISPILERVCETEKAKETASIALPDDDASIFERLLGYLYFQNSTRLYRLQGGPLIQDGQTRRKRMALS